MMHFTSVSEKQRTYFNRSLRHGIEMRHRNMRSDSALVHTGYIGLHRVSVPNPTGHWGSSGINSWTPPFLHIHYITGSHHTGTWLLLPLLCWWHTALSLISTKWSNGSFPPSSGMLNPWQFSSETWKLISSVITWLHLKKKKNFAPFP